MATNVIMPALGAAQKTGRLIRWYRAEGESVTKGEPLMEVETDKVTLDIEAPADGVLAAVTGREGDDVPVGQVIGLILAPDERPQAPTRRPPVSPVAARIAAEHGVEPASIPAAGHRVAKADVLAFLTSRHAGSAHGPVAASPRARRLAAEHGLSLQTIAGSGPDGAVLAADVLRAAEGAPAPPAASATALPPPAPAPEPATTISASGAWQVMAERTAASWRSAPHFYLVREVDAGALLRWREQAGARLTVRLTITDLLVRLVALALREHPRLNAAWQDGALVQPPAIAVGLAVAVEDGLVVPVIHDADRLGLRAIAERRAALVERAQAGRLSLADVRGGSFTISNLGMYGVDAFNAILNPPQAAILAVGRIAERAVVVGGQVVARPTMALTLSCDHRVLDGARAAQFLGYLGRLIEDPLAALD